MLHFEVSAQSGVPAYRQVMDQVGYYVASGALRPRDRLPSIRELARYLRVNPATVVKAYGELAHRGVIEQHQGKGAFVLDGTAALSKAERRSELGKLTRQLAVEARQMGATDKEVLESVRDALRSMSAGVRHRGKAGAAR